MREAELSLPLLRLRIKADPGAFENEFSRQCKHFSVQLEALRLQKSQRADARLGELAMFVAESCQHYPGRPEEVLRLTSAALLAPEAEGTAQDVRRSLVSAIMLLGKSGRVPLLSSLDETACDRSILPLAFRLFAEEDKQLRGKLFAHIIGDLKRIKCNRKSKSGVKKRFTHPEEAKLTNIQSFFVRRLRDSTMNPLERRQALGLCIEIFRRRLAADPRGLIQSIAGCCFHIDRQVVNASANFFLGHPSRGSDLVESDPSVDLDGPKKKRPHWKALSKVERERDAVEREEKRREARLNSAFDLGMSHAAIDLVLDPQKFTEDLLKKSKSRDLPFASRLLLLNTASRAMGRHRLFCPRFFEAAAVYLRPKQKRCTDVMCFIVQASHDMVPPDALNPITRTLMTNFVSQDQPPEVITVGLNALRELGTRAPLALTADDLEDLCGFDKVKDRGVGSALRGLINVYREVCPKMLPKAARGKDATMAIIRNEDHSLAFGSAPVAEGVLGAEDYLRATGGSPEGRRGSWHAGAIEEASEGVESRKRAAAVMADEFFATSDFQKIKRLRLMKEEKRRAGAWKKNADCGDEGDTPLALSENSSDASSDDDEERESVLAPSDLLPSAVKKRRHQEVVLRERELRKASHGARAAQGTKEGTSLPNSVRARNKPMMMVARKRRGKSQEADASAKAANLRRHLKNLAKRTGGKSRFRRK